MYNGLTQKFVMYAHIDDAYYVEAKVGVATGDSICGSYEYQGSFRPLEQESRDMGLFQDIDGQGYLLTEDVSVISQYMCKSDSETLLSARMDCA